MAEEHIGSLVLIDCGPTLGMYQGRILNVDPDTQSITLERPLRNGVPYQVPKLTVKAESIVDLKILQLADEYEKSVSDVLSSCRSSGKPNDKTGNVSAVSSVFPNEHYSNGHHGASSPSRGSQNHSGHGKVKVSSKFQQHQQSVHLSPGDLFKTSEFKKSAKSSSPNLRRPHSRPKEHQNAVHRDDMGFVKAYDDGIFRKQQQLSDLSAPLDFNLMATDFDFEANLAKFEKLPCSPRDPKATATSAKQDAVLGQLLNNLESTTRDGTSMGPGSAKKNIRHDENIVQDPLRVYVGAKRNWRYMTDDGLELPSLTAAEKRKLYDQAMNKGWITQDGFTYAVADAAARVSLQLLKEQGIPVDSASFYMIFSSVDAVPMKTAKHLSRFFVNRGSWTTWVLTDSMQYHQRDPGVAVLADAHSLANSSPSGNSLVFVIGRQGILSDEVSAWLLRHAFSSIVFVETDWRGVDSLIPDEDLLMRLGVDGGALVKLPSRLLLCWQLPCREADTDLKSPMYICDTNMSTDFLQTELAALGIGGQKKKNYKFPFQHGSVVNLRKL